MNNKQISTSVLVAASIFVSTPLFAEEAFTGSSGIDKIYSFGDSLTDTGNFFNITNGAFPPNGYYFNGRFSNGRIWNEKLEQQLGIKKKSRNYYQPMGQNLTSLDRGLNFAVGGSKTGLGHINPDADCTVTNTRCLGLQAQIDDYKNLLNGGQADPNALYIIWSGANDYFDPSGTFPNPLETVGNIATAAFELAALGAKNIAIANLPNLGDIPLAQRQGEPAITSANLLTAAHNQLLSFAVGGLGFAFQNTNFIELEINQLASEILNNPREYGFIDNAKSENCTNIDDFPVLPSPDELTFCSNPNKYAFWDNQHPTRRLHREISEYAYEEIVSSLDGVSSTQFSVAASTAKESVPEPSAVVAITLLGFGVLQQMRGGKRS
jgi:phospholipase/lecithinase/hemolysin